MSAAATVICFDIGRTSCRIRAYDIAPAHGPVAHGRGPLIIESGSTLADAEGPARVADLVGSGVHSVGKSTPTANVAASVAVAGGLEHRAAAIELAGLLQVGHGLPALVTGDVVAAHAGCFNGARGVVLAAGSGAVALGLDASGIPHKVDGDGYLVGDAGSGFFVGRAGLRAALRHRDGRPGGSAALAACAVRQFGPLTTLSGRLHARDDAPRAVASFATYVAEQARAGDPVSQAIWRRAVDALADTATAAVEAVAAGGPVGDVPLALAGGLFDSLDLVTDPLCARLAERFPAIRRSEGDALLGAARMAARPTSSYEALLVRAKTWQTGPQGTTRGTPRGTPQQRESEARR